MPVENVIITEGMVFANQRKLQLVDAIRMLIGLTDIFANHMSQKARIKKWKNIWKIIDLHLMNCAQNMMSV